MRRDSETARWVREVWSDFWADEATRAILLAAVLLFWTVGAFLTGLTTGAGLERTAIERMALEALR